jgi:Cd2+-exporting ATPase
MGCCTGCAPPPAIPKIAQTAGHDAGVAIDPKPTCSESADVCCGKPMQAEKSEADRAGICGESIGNDKRKDENTTHSGDDICCKPASDNAAVDASVDDCHAGCCGSAGAELGAVIATDSCVDDSCCGPKVVEGSSSSLRRAKDDCKAAETPIVVDWTDKCCAESALANEKPKQPPCCTGKPTPCCDTSCLDRLAVRECRGITVGRGKEKPTPCCIDGCDPETPCSEHKRRVRSRFAARLEALECICSALVALGQASCCVSTPRSSVDRRRVSRPQSRISIDSCCSPGPVVISNKYKKKPSAKNGPEIRDSCPEGAQKLSTTSSCADACCREKVPRDEPAEARKHVASNVASATDLENGLSGHEHIILSVSGMTCTGCETKLSRTLGSLSNVKNLKTSLVLSRAEFDLDLRASSVAETIAYMQKRTEFKFEHISQQGSTIVVIPKGNVKTFLEMDYPIGVTEMSAIDQKSVRVVFDAKIVGARDLLYKGFATETPPELAPLQADPALAASSKHVRHIGYMTLLSAILTVPVLVLAWAPLTDHEIIYGSTSLALATIIQFVVAGPFYPKCLKALIFSHVVEMDLLIVLSTTTAYIFSVVAFGLMVSEKPLLTGQFFETSTLLVTLIMVGRWVSAFARQKAIESISIRSLQASTATLINESGEEKQIDARLLQYGDSFKVNPHSRIPTDGTIVSGSSEVDESMITGESRPVKKSPKSAIIAGSINGSGTIVARLTRLPGDNTISSIADMVDAAKLSKPKIQEMADKVSSYFVPVILAITVITFAVWIAVGIAVKGQSGSEAAVVAITYAITVLIVSCPCAIGLATPMVIVVASGRAADRGVIIKSSEVLEIAHKTSHVVFDKTGTLTQGKLTVVVEELSAESQRSTTLGLLLGLLGSIKHPVSVAVATHLKSMSVLSAQVDDVRSIPGKGVEGATPLDQTLRAGNALWLGVSNDPRVRAILDQGYTTFCFTVNGSLAAVFGLEDSLRPDALEAVASLRRRGIAVSILSGDDDGAVRSIASQLGIPDTNVRSRCSPVDKKIFIEDLLVPKTSTGKKLKAPVVIFCGDGTNDAVALAQASIGVHINEGTDVAQSAADVVLMRPNLLGILSIINLSQLSVRRIGFNFGWSFVYNMFAILLAAGAFVNARIPPEFAGLGELVSVLPVIAAALLLRWSKI